MKIFRYEADRLPIASIAAFFALDVAVYALVDSPAWLVAWVVLGLVPRGGVAAFNHHHQHVPVFRVAILNRLLEIMYGLQTGITSHGWVLHHSLGHHVTYLDQRRDTSRWQRADGAQMGSVEYALVVGATAYPRMWEVLKRFPRYTKLFVGMTALTLAIAAGLVWLRPVPGLVVFVTPMVLMLFHTAFATYTHHAGKKTSSHFLASNNILSKSYNVLTGNLGYHTAHHYKPGVHWSELPALHRSIAERIPADCYVTPGVPWNLVQRVVGPPEGMPFASGSSADERYEPSVAPAVSRASSSSFLPRLLP